MGLFSGIQWVLNEVLPVEVYCNYRKPHHSHEWKLEGWTAWCPGIKRKKKK